MLLTAIIDSGPQKRASNPSLLLDEAHSNLNGVTLTRRVKS